MQIVDKIRIYGKIIRPKAVLVVGGAKPGPQIKALKDGTLDCIATDHAPHTIEEKEGTFDLAPFGMIGLESCFGAVNKVLVKENNLDQLDLIQMLTTRPRKIMGFNDNLLDIGVNAELTIIDPNEEWIFSRADIQSKSYNSPFIGQNMYGRVKYTICKDHISVI